MGMGIFLDLPHSLKSEVQSNDAVKLKCIRLMCTCPSRYPSFPIIILKSLSTYMPIQ